MELFKMLRLNNQSRKLQDVPSAMDGIERAMVEGPGVYRLQDEMGPLLTFRLHYQALVVNPRPGVH